MSMMSNLLFMMSQPSPITPPEAQRMARKSQMKKIQIPVSPTREKVVGLDLPLPEPESAIGSINLMKNIKVSKSGFRFSISRQKVSVSFPKREQLLWAVQDKRVTLGFLGVANLEEFRAFSRNVKRSVDSKVDVDALAIALDTLGVSNLEIPSLDDLRMGSTYKLLPDDESERPMNSPETVEDAIEDMFQKEENCDWFALLDKVQTFSDETDSEVLAAPFKQFSKRNAAFTQTLACGLAEWRASSYYYIGEIDKALETAQQIHASPSYMYGPECLRVWTCSIISVCLYKLRRFEELKTIFVSKVNVDPERQKAVHKLVADLLKQDKLPLKDFRKHIN